MPGAAARRAFRSVEAPIEVLLRPSEVVRRIHFAIVSLLIKDDAIATGADVSRVIGLVRGSDLQSDVGNDALDRLDNAIRRLAKSV